MNNNRRGVIEPLERIREGMSSVSSFDDLYGGRDDDEAVYVAVGRQSEETSMDALIWVLNNAVIPSSTLVFLIHVFPETKYIPTPLGKLPISQVNPEQKENYMIQETAKRRQFLQKFLTLCSASQVKVDTILIESEMEAKAIVDLIPILNIKKLVLGTTKSDLRRMRSRRGNGVIDQILSNAPESCEVKIICEGNEMSELPLDSPSPRSHQGQLIRLLFLPKSNHPRFHAVDRLWDLRRGGTSYQSPINPSRKGAALSPLHLFYMPTYVEALLRVNPNQVSGETDDR
ncbi:hypothetical protein DH2020_041508 [Rehmannia glutinosa]|uniref:U-box domain-containing protein n=1 Tax=Rehmannia glutinosa TaxID=99300 RepID=A0ABR0UR52_REHGL